MLKQCSVTLNNPAVTVVRFDDHDVQLPAIGYEAKKIFVEFKNGKYIHVSDCAAKAEVAEPQVIKPLKRAPKKTTIEDESVSVDKAGMDEEKN